MKSLSKQFQGRGDTAGWLFRQVRRNGQYAIYERIRGEEAIYEVIRIRQFSSDKRVNGRLLASSGQEYYPKPSEWGLYAWSLTTREEAEDKFNQLIRDWESRSLRTNLSDAHCVGTVSPV